MKDQVDHELVKKPSLILGLTEGIRALVDFGWYFPYRFFVNREEEGDNHPVLILPGFMATDFSTVPLRSFVYKLGYKVYGWGEGRNYAHTVYLDLLNQKISRIFKKHNQAITIIGWSLGGIYARQLAKTHPHMVRQVITMGSPFKGVTIANNATWMYDLLRKSNIIEKKLDEKILEDIPNPAPVPTTAIYTKEDGVVPWELCLEDEDEWHQNIQVRGSHLGLGVNPLVLQIIADRLQLDKSNWTYFETNNIVEDLLVCTENS